jgi:hypothetical protein
MIFQVCINLFAIRLLYYHFKQSVHIELLPDIDNSCINRLQLMTNFVLIFFVTRLEEADNFLFKQLEVWKGILHLLQSDLI